MKTSELYQLFDVYIMTSKVFNEKIRQIVKEELGQAINFSYADSNAAQPIKETRIPSNTNIATPKLATPVRSNTPRIPIDRAAIMPVEFGKVGLKEQIVVPGTGGMVTIDADDAEVYEAGEEPVDSVMDNINAGMSTGVKALDEALTKNYSQFVKNTNKNRKTA